MKTTVSWLILGLGLSVAACTKAPEVEMPCLDHKTEETATVKLVIWNDFHASLYEMPDKDDPQKALGGLPIFMAAVKAAKGDGLSLLIDAGDMFQGSMPINASRGLAQIEIFNDLGLDISTLGNHEFDYGPSLNAPTDNRSSLSEAIDQSQFTWVNANVVANSDDVAWPPSKLKPYAIIQKGPYRIAFIGLLTQETVVATLAENVEGLSFNPVAETLQRILPEVSAQNPDFTIVIGHLTGESKTPIAFGKVAKDVVFDGEIGEVLALPKDIKDQIDLFVTGHSHLSFLAYDGDLLVLQSQSNGRELTTMELEFADGKLQIMPESIAKELLIHEIRDTGCSSEPYSLAPLDVGGKILTPDAHALELISKYENAMDEKRCDIMGCIDDFLYRSRQEENPAGNLVADALLDHFPTADVALQNPGGLRTDLAIGPFYRENLNALMPFDNELYLTEMPGSELASALQVGASLKHGLIQVAGASYSFEPNCKNPEDLNHDGQIEDWENNCLCGDIQIAGKALDKDKIYRVVITNFMLNGGDSLGGLFKDTKIIEKGPVVKKVLQSYVQKQKGCISLKQLIQPEAPRMAPKACKVYF